MGRIAEPVVRCLPGRGLGRKKEAPAHPSRGPYIYEENFLTQSCVSSAPSDLPEREGSE